MSVAKRSGLWICRPCTENASAQVGTSVIRYHKAGETCPATVADDNQVLIGYRCTKDHPVTEAPCPSCRPSYLDRATFDRLNTAAQHPTPDTAEVATQQLTDAFLETLRFALSNYINHDGTPPLQMPRNVLPDLAARLASHAVTHLGVEDHR